MGNLIKHTFWIIYIAFIKENEVKYIYFGTFFSWYLEAAIKINFIKETHNSEVAVVALRYW
jgi:hypothetical protein